MELIIDGKKDNILLNRVEIKFRVTHPNEKTADRKGVKKMIAKNQKVPEEQVIVDHMNTSFGMSETEGYAKIYKTKEDALKVENKYMLLRNDLIKKDDSNE